MNQQAERHLVRATSLFDKGDSYYEKAVDEILAAQEADPTLSNREAGAWFGRSEKWVRDIVRWRTTSSPETNVDWNRGSHATTAEIEEGARKLLATAPLEQVERIVQDLPRNRQKAIGAAAGHSYLKARQEEDEREARLTPAQRKEREAQRASTHTAVGKMMSGFNAFGIVNHLEAAAEILKEMIEATSVTPEVVEAVEKGLLVFLTEFRVARGVAGLDTDLEGVLG